MIKDGGNDLPSALMQLLVVNRERSSVDGAVARPPEFIGRYANDGLIPITVPVSSILLQKRRGIHYRILPQACPTRSARQRNTNSQNITQFEP